MTREEFLETKKINVLKWLAKSPGLNPIENLWNDIGHHLEQKNRRT